MRRFGAASVDSSSASTTGRAAIASTRTRKLIILKKIQRVEEDALTYEPDPKHVKLLWEGVKLTEESKGLESPVVKEERLDEARRWVWCGG